MLPGLEHKRLHLRVLQAKETHIVWNDSVESARHDRFFRYRPPEVHQSHFTISLSRLSLFISTDT